MQGQRPFLNVDFDTRNAIKLFVGERSKTVFDSGCKMFDLIIHEPHCFDTISFHNYYTAYLTIKAKVKTNSNKEEWKILVKRLKLMESAHGETGANKNYTINKDILNFKNIKNIYQLRFILQQPSIYWRDFNIDEIKITQANPSLTLEKVLEEYVSRCESTTKVRPEKMPPIEDISTRLQNLWYICQEAGKQTKSSIEDNPKYDVIIGVFVLKFFIARLFILNSLY